MNQRQLLKGGGVVSTACSIGLFCGRVNGGGLLVFAGLTLLYRTCRTVGAPMGEPRGRTIQALLLCRMIRSTAVFAFEVMRLAADSFAVFGLGNRCGCLLFVSWQASGCPPKGNSIPVDPNRSDGGGSNSYGSPERTPNGGVMTVGGILGALQMRRSQQG